MTMKDKCKQAVALAAGRALSDRELGLIEDHLKGAMKRVYLENPKAAAGMAPSDLYAKAVAQARKEIVQEAVEAKIRSAQNIAKAAANLDYVNGHAPAAAVKSLYNLLTMRASLDKSGRQSVESRQEAMGRDAWGKMPALGAILKEEQRLASPFLDELFGRASGDPLAKKAAAEWNAAIDDMHAAAKLAGMPIGKLDNWRLPQRQSSYKVAANRDAWVEDHMGWVDRQIYRNPDGTMFTDEQMREFLGKAADTIATDGAAKDSNGGGGFSTSRRSYQKERQIHFRDADSWRAAQAKYGDKTVAQLLANHTVAFSRDIALTEAFGSDYRGAFQELLRQATLRAKDKATARESLERIDHDAGVARRYFDALVGDSGHTSPEGAAWARRFDIIRNAVTFATMGGAGPNSMPDMAGFSMIARLSNLPEIQLWLKTMRNFLSPRSAADKALATRIGLGVQTILEDVRRYVRDDPVMNFSAKAANFTVVAGLLHRFEEGKAMAVASVMHDAIGALTRRHEWDALPKGDRLIFESSGVDKATWDLWRAADLERGDDGSRTILLPAHLYDLPDTAVDAAIAPKLRQLQDLGGEAVSRLTAQSDRERDWMAGRAAKLEAYADKLAATLDAYRATREKALGKLGADTDARIDLIEAQMERLRAEKDIAAYLATKDAQGRQLRLLEQVEDGASVGRGTVQERVHPDRRPDAVVTNWAKTPGVGEQSAASIERFSRRRGAIGEDLGARLAKAERRIKDAEKRVKEAEELAAGEIDDKRRDLNGRLAARIHDLDVFSREMRDRIVRRNELAAEWRRQIGDRIDSLRDEARRDAALKLSGVVGREMKIASGSPGIERRVDLGLDINRTGLMSEISRSMLFLKATPMSILHNYWQRSASMGEITNPALLRARYFVTAAVLGVMVMNLKNLLVGQDAFNPLDLEQEKYAPKLIKSVLSGGGFGVYGDMLLQDPSGSKNTHSMSGLIGGPIIGTADDVMTLYQDAAHWAVGGKADIGGDTVRFAKRHLTPNIFYAKALLDHYIFQQLQEMFSPGYNARAQARMEKGTGTKYWWDFGKTEPKRAPEFAR
ncbi:hypothetical protein [Phaeospirillum tilakii]|uniref:Uncharacterized protein n=1 Tax=Phaeospirillum tilakii TaxID=741673 RepID=A0ABW5CFD8_9PROT